MSMNAMMNREINHYEDIETDDPVEESSLPVRHSVVSSGRERNHDAPQVRNNKILISCLLYFCKTIIIMDEGRFCFWPL